MTCYDLRLYELRLRLFSLTIVGVYGDVHRVKILYNKKDNALIQMAEPFQAQQGKLRFITF